MTTSSYGFKMVGVGETRARISRRACLEKLSAVLQSMGSDKSPVWHDDKGDAKSSYVRSLDDQWLDMVKKLLGRGIGVAKGDFWEVYFKLGTKSLDSDCALRLLTCLLAVSRGN